MTHILLWHWNRRGGGPRYNWELARALSERDDVRVSVTYSRQSEFADLMRGLDLPGFEVDTYTSARGLLAGLARVPAIRRRFVSFLREEKVDVVVSTMNHLWSPLFAPAIRRAGVPYALVAHDAEPHPGEQNVVRRVTLSRDIAAADALIAPTQHVMNRLVELRPDVPESRRAVIPLGSFAYGEVREAPRARPEGRPVELLFFGRLLAYKGIDVLADAFARLRETHGDDVRLTVAGMGDEATYGTRLRGLPGAEWQNRWVGEEEIEGLLASADVLLLPYREASQSGSLAAAEHSGLPSVSTPVGGLAEELTAHGSGVVADEVTGEAFARAVGRLLEEPGLYETCSANALRTAAGPKSWGTVAERLADFSKALVTR